jgi:hypothetical protein
MTTSSEGGVPGRIVQSQEPKWDHTQIGDGDGEALKDALSDEADLNVTVISGELSSNTVTIGGGFAMQVLVTGTAGNAVHGGHPEVIGVNADGVRTACLKKSSILKRRP